MSQINMDSLLNILKTYHVNTHQGKTRPSTTKGSDSLKLALDTRRSLGGKSERKDQGQVERSTENTQSQTHTQIQTQTLPAHEGIHILPHLNYSETPSQVGKPFLNENPVPPNKKQKRLVTPISGA